MSQAQAYADIMAVVTRLQAEFTDFALVVEPGHRKVVDQATQQDPYLKMQIDFLPGGGQLDLGEAPLARQVGQLCLYAVAKQDSGELAARRLLDFAVPYFECQTKGIVRFQAAQAVRERDIAGWTYFPVLIEIWYDRLVTKK